MPAIPLEDLFNDVLSKAALGLKLKPEVLAARVGLDVPAVQKVLKGEFDEITVRKLAPLLGLGEEQLVALAKDAYSPEAAAPEGLLAFNTPYHDFFVNAYLIEDRETKQAVVFDTGSDPEALLQAVRERGLTVSLILLTHAHPDHVMGLDALLKATGAPAYISPKEPLPGTLPVEPGQTFQVGKLKIKALSTWGHSAGGTSYLVTGLAVPVVVVGDALFAGSMGRGNISYPDALANNRREIFSLPEETVIAPGHGPLTTVGLEKRNNPFYPEFAR